MNELSALHALITRPKPQALSLTRRIREAGGRVELLATIEIVSQFTQPQLAQQLASQPTIDKLFFISPSTITTICPLLQQTPTIAWQQLPCFVMGEPSANLLRQYGAQQIFYPPIHYCTEGALALPQLQQVTQQHLVIFKGEGGRPLLADTLRQRGAHVTEIVCYQRALPTLAADDPCQDLQRAGINCIITTSVVSADNLWILLAPTGNRWLQQRQWLVSSQRIAHHLRQRELSHAPLIAQNASDDAIMNTLLNNANLFSHQSRSKGI